MAIELTDCSFSRAVISQTRFSFASTPGYTADAQNLRPTPLHLKIHASLLT